MTLHLLPSRSRIPGSYSFFLPVSSKKPLLFTFIGRASYPDVYDPQNGMSKPSMTLILTVHCNGTKKTIKAENISLSFVSEDEKGQAFLSVCEAISNRLTATEEWNALPDYENLYE